MRQNKKGFTLIELLLVMIILVFLVAIIVITGTNFHLDAKKRSMYTSLRRVKTAIDVYNIKYEVFPGNLNQLVNILPKEDRLLDVIPTDIFREPRGPVSYHLNATNNRTYVCWSYGPNKLPEISAAGVDTIIGGPGDDIFVTNARGRVYEP